MDPETSWRPRATRIVTTYGFVVCLLPSTMVVLSQNVESFQVCAMPCSMALALLLMAAGMIAGPLLDNSTLVACLAAVGTVVKGWTDFKQYRFKVTMSGFAFTTYAKALTELKTHGRGVPLEDLERIFDQDANVG